MKLMRLRKGRLNTVEVVDDKAVRKIGVIKEKERPYRLKVEAWAISQARLQGINVPQVFNYHRDSAGREVLVLERIYGRRLSQNIFEGKGDARIMLEVGSQLALLSNSLINRGWGWIDPTSMTGFFNTWQSFLVFYVQEYGGSLVNGKILKEDELRKMFNAFDTINLKISKSTLLNRDIKPANIIVDNNEKVWIVDWENAILGDPLYDIAIFGVRNGEGMFWKNLVDGLKTEIPLPKYTLYKIIGLIGIIDFYQRHQIDCRGRQQQLHKLIKLIQ